MKRPARWLRLLPAVLAAGCAAGPSQGESVEALLRAPRAVLVEGRQVVLETYLWRDFMPVTPPGGRPLAARVTIRAVDGGPLPPALAADRLWVVHGRRVWAAPLTALDEPQPRGRWSALARGGPKWDPDVAVDVIVRLVDRHGRRHLLRASRQYIRRTM